MAAVDFKVAMNEYLKSIEVPFSHDRSKTVGASELGKCARAVVYDKIGTAPDEGLNEDRGFTGRGNVMEDHVAVPMVKMAVEKAGGELLYAGQHEQVTLVGKGVPISCTPDGLGINLPRDFLANYGVQDIGPSRSVVFEFKSISPRYNKEKLPKYAHPIQGMTQLGMIRLATKYKPDFAIIPYTDADCYTDVRAWPVKWNEPMFKSLTRRADMILKAKDPNTFPPEGKIRGGNECGECKHARKCLGYRPYLVDDDPRAPTKAQVKKVEVVAKKVKELEAREAAIKSERLEAEGELIVTLASVKRKFVQTPSLVIHHKETKSQNRTDAKKLVALLKAKGATDAEIESCRSETKAGTSLSVEAR